MMERIFPEIGQKLARAAKEGKKVKFVVVDVQSFEDIRVGLEELTGLAVLGDVVVLNFPMGYHYRLYQLKTKEHIVELVTE